MIIIQCRRVETAAANRYGCLISQSRVVKLSTRKLKNRCVPFTDTTNASVNYFSNERRVDQMFLQFDFSICSLTLPSSSRVRQNATTTARPLLFFPVFGDFFSEFLTLKNLSLPVFYLFRFLRVWFIAYYPSNRSSFWTLTHVLLYLFTVFLTFQLLIVSSYKSFISLLFRISYFSLLFIYRPMIFLNIFSLKHF